MDVAVEAALAATAETAERMSMALMMNLLSGRIAKIGCWVCGADCWCLGISSTWFPDSNEDFFELLLTGEVDSDGEGEVEDEFFGLVGSEPSGYELDVLPLAAATT